MAYPSDFIRVDSLGDCGCSARLHDVPKVAPLSPRIAALGGGTGLPAVLEGLAGMAADFGETDRRLPHRHRDRHR